HQQVPHVSLRLEPFHVVLAELGVGAPVDVLDLVARRVLLVLGELHRLPVHGALVQAGEDPLHHLARANLERSQPRQEGRIERHARASRSSCATTARESTPSASAWKLVRTRCRMTGSANARTSSTVAAGRASSAARALAPTINACEARGPAPQAT